MRRVALVTITSIALMGLGTGTAGASVHRVDEESFCETLRDVSDIDANSFDPGSTGAFNDYADTLRDAAPFAPRKVKKAMKRLAKFYDSIGDGDGFDAGLFSDNRFLKASTTYSTYYAETCAGIDIPNS